MAETKAEPRDRGLPSYGDLDSSQWDEAPAPNTRPVDVAGENSTFGSRRKKATSKAKAVQSSSAEDKAVKRSTSK